MGTRQALARVRNWHLQEEKFSVQLPKAAQRAGGFALDSVLLLQVLMGVLILLREPEPVKDAIVKYDLFGWFFLLALITGIWGIGHRKIFSRFGAWFIKIGAPIR